MICLERVTKTYAVEQGLTVLKGVDLAIEARQFVGIIGRSGSGKSTLLHIMGLLDRPTTGRILFDGQDTGALGDDAMSKLRGRAIGFVFQSFHLVPHLSTVENVELPLFYQHVPPRERRRIAERCLDRVGMTHRMRHVPGQLSGGECQRVAVARALVADPPLILADEPTGNLDTKTGAEVFDLLRALHASGKTIVIITHDLALAARTQRTIQIVDGLIVKEI